jgi:chemotaxis protein MotB
MSKANCKCKTAECEECPEWIFTFADLVMLMMGFFVILWVLKPAVADPSKQQQILPMDVLIAIREAFQHLPDPNSTDPVDVEMIKRKLEQMKVNGPGAGGKSPVEPTAPEGSDREVEMIRPSKQVGTGAKVLFAPSEARLSAESMRSLEQIAQLVRGHRNIFMVKGHTSSDDFPDGTDDSLKMDLSLRRAKAAADYLVSQGVDRETIRVQGCSTYEPVIQRAYTGDAKNQNRRVEVESTATLVKELQDSPRTRGPVITRDLPPPPPPKEH